MFTGIIEEIGVVQSLQRLGNRASLTVAARKVVEDLSIGDSIAVNGACLTATSVSASSFYADVSPETLRVTTLSGLRPGDRVNLERALRLSDRLGGHLVQGHVDDTATILDIRHNGDTLILKIGIPASIRQYIVQKGSITIDGISLTITTVDDASFTCALIPHTIQQTTLNFKQAGDRVNIESDIIGRYIEKLMQIGQETPVSKRLIDMEMLKEHGWR